MATITLVNQHVQLDTATGKVTLQWTEGIPPGHPDPINWKPEHVVELELPGEATVTPPMPAEQPLLF